MKIHNIQQKKKKKLPHSNSKQEARDQQLKSSHHLYIGRGRGKQDQRILLANYRKLQDIYLNQSADTICLNADI